MKKLCASWWFWAVVVIVVVIAFNWFGGTGKEMVVLDEDSRLTQEDVRILQKSFNDLTDKEKIRLITMQTDMTIEELKTFKNDFKRLYVEELEGQFSSREEAEKAFEVSFARDIEKKEGTATPVEEPETKKTKTAEDVKKYITVFVGKSKILNITVDDKDITLLVDLGQAEGRTFKPEVSALGVYQLISGRLLQDEYWNDITVEFKDVGKITMNTAQRQGEENRTYFDTADIEKNFIPIK